MQEIIIHLLIGPLVLIISILFRLFPPKKINLMYGYRTKRSMRSQEAWDYANRVSPNLLILVSLITIGSQFLLSSFLHREQAALYSCAVLVVLLLLTFPVMERKLKRRFGEEE